MATDAGRRTAARALLIALLVFTLFASTGCLGGALFTWVTVPLDRDFDATPSSPGGRGTSQKRVVIPYPVRIQFDWGSTAIADGMRKAGITKAHYADVETRSFMGVWTQRWIHVYGE